MSSLAGDFRRLNHSGPSRGTCICTCIYIDDGASDIEACSEGLHCIYYTGNKRSIDTYMYVHLATCIYPGGSVS